LALAFGNFPKAAVTIPWLTRQHQEEAAMHISRRNLIYGIGAGALTAAPPARAFLTRLSGPEQTTEKKLSFPIRLDKNENVYGPPESAIAAMREGLTHVNRYPETTKLLEQKLAKLHNVKAEQIVLGCGSSDVLRMAGDAFLTPGKKLIMATPSYPLLAYYAQNKKVEVVNVPLTPEGAHDLKAMLAKVDSSTGLIYICNPNNPTGTLTGRKELDEFVSKVPPDIPVLVDEAYHHYVIPSPSYAAFLEHPVEGRRIIVARTFSKIYGLAGVRIGYAVTPPEVARQLYPFWLQFAENEIGVRAAMAALDDSEHVRRTAQRTADDRQEFRNQAKARMTPTSDSQTNFILLQLDHPIDEVIAHFRKNKVLVGPHFPGLDNFLRVSLGLPEEMKEFWRVWDLLPHDNMRH